jgi:hypothetical protein
MMIFLAQRGDPVPFWFLFLSVGMWLFVSYLLSHDGWGAFAERYGGTVSRPTGPAFGSPHTRFNKSRLSDCYNVVRVVPSADGLWFYAMILFRPFHPPFFVPWSLVTHVESLSIWHLHGYRVHIRSEVGTMAVTLRWTFREALLQFRPDLLQPSKPPSSSEVPGT